MLFETKVHGIPCLCQVIDYTPSKPGQIYGPEIYDFDVPESERIDFELLDRRGYKAPWLEKLMNEDDPERLLEEFKLEMFGQKYGVEY